MMSMLLVLVVVAVMTHVSTAFTAIPSTTRWMVKSRIPSSLSTLRMSSNEDALNAIREKMQSNPNYDPMQDPEALRVLENMIPDAFREFSNSISRLNVALTDATTGVDAVDDLDASARLIANKKDLMSAPQSKWMQQGMNEEYVDDAVAEALLNTLREQNPQIPYGQQ